MALTQANYNQLILSNIDWVNYQENEPENKVKFLADVFESEYGWRVNQVGLQTACRDYLQGLPSSCTLPFTYVDIEKWAKEQIGRELTTSEYNVLTGVSSRDYWTKAAQAMMLLIKKYL